MVIASSYYAPNLWLGYSMLSFNSERSSLKYMSKPKEVSFCNCSQPGTFYIHDYQSLNLKSAVFLFFPPIRNKKEQIL